MITVNGRETDHVPGESVDLLLKRLNFVFPMVVVKVDGQVVPKLKFPETEIPDGSAIEVIHIESGG